MKFLVTDESGAKYALIDAEGAGLAAAEFATAQLGQARAMMLTSVVYTLGEVARFSSIVHRTCDKIACQTTEVA